MKARSVGGVWTALFILASCSTPSEQRDGAGVDGGDPDAVRGPDHDARGDATSAVPDAVPTVRVIATASANGTVVASGISGGTCAGTTCTLDSGASTVTFTALPDAGSRFGGWSGCSGYSAKDNAITFTNPSAAAACTATFIGPVAVSAMAGTGGSVAASGISGGTCAGTTCTLELGASTVTFIPTASTGHHFSGWSGCTGYTSGSGDAITFTNPTAPATCTASFAATVAVGATARPGGTVTASQLSGGTCSGTSCTLTAGASTVTFTALASAGYRFDGWSNCSGYSVNNTSITFSNPTAPQSCVASFVPTVSLSVTTTFGGVVTANGVTGGTCANASCTLDAGASTVTFTPVAYPSYRFGGWSGCSGYTTQGDAIMFTNPVSSATCMAVFIATTTAGATAGSGGTVTVASVANGTCSGTTCTLDAGIGDVTFLATPASNYRFGVWSGPACFHSQSPYPTLALVDVTASEFCTANFVAIVTVTGVGTGGGTVGFTNVLGGSCTGSTCTFDYGVASGVTLVPVPDANHYFTGWSGPTCSFHVPNMDGSITFTNPTSNAYCTAMFAAF